MTTQNIIDFESRLSPIAASGPGTQVTSPGKLLRLAAVARAMLDEARDAPCDPAGCERMRLAYRRTVHELAGLLSDDLRLELYDLVATFENDSPSPSELRIAQAELVGWLEGLFTGIAAAVRAQQEQVSVAGGEPVPEVERTSMRPMPGQYL